MGFDEEPPAASPGGKSAAGNRRDFRLVGTAVTGDPVSSLAIIERLGASQQEYFREGDRIGKVFIKKIERKRVILVTAAGLDAASMGITKTVGSASEAASMRVRETAASAQNSSPEVIVSDDPGAAAQRLRPVRRSSRYRQARRKALAARMAREEVRPAGAEPGELLQLVDVDPQN